MSLLAAPIFFILFSLTSRESFLQNYKDTTPLDVSLTTDSTLDTISVANFTISEQGSIYLFLSSKLMRLDQSTEKLKASKDVQVKTIDYTEMNAQINFSYLQANSTYYLYYYGENHINRKRSELSMVTIQTQAEVVLPTIDCTQYIIQFFAIFMPSFFMIVLFFILKQFNDENVFETPTAKDCDSCVEHWEKPKGYISGPVNSELQQVLSWCRQLPYKLYDIFSEEIVVPENKSDIRCLNQVLEAENKEFADNQICGICCENPREVIFSCGHIYCCIKCSLKLNVCPMDQKPIHTKYRFTICDKYGGIEKHSSMDDIKMGFSQNLLVSLFGCSNSEGTIGYVTPKQQTPEERYIELKRKNEKYKDYFKCIECKQKKKDTMFLDCCHLNYCQDCAKKIKVCPWDKMDVRRTQKAYIA